MLKESKEPQGETVSKVQPYKATEAMINTWKKEYGDIFHVKIKDKACYLRKPDRIILGAMELSKSNIHSSELILNQCWLAGDDEIKTDDNLFIGVAGQLGRLIDFEIAELKKI